MDDASEEWNTYRRAVLAADIGVWTWHSVTDRIDLSARAARLLGHSSAEPLSHDGLLALVYAEDRAALDRVLRAAARSSDHYDIHFRAAMPVATKNWVRVLGRFRRDPRGASEMHGILIDVTEHKQVEEVNSRLAAIVNSSDDAIVGKTIDGIVTDWNRGAETIFGYTAEEIVGRPVSLLLPTDQEDEMSEILRRIREGERIDHYETRRRRKDGAIIDVSLTVSPVWDRAGHLLGASKVVRDITRAKRAQAALREREAHLQSVLDTVPDAVIVTDGTGLIQSFSATAERLFGHEAQAIIGHDIAALLPHGDRARSGLFDIRHLIGQNRVATGLRKDGSTFPMELSVGEMWAGESCFFTGFVRDLTERQDTERRLQQLQAELVHISRLTAMGEMSSTLAHELNQPLTAIVSFLNGCRRLLGDPSPQNMTMIRDAVDRATAQALRTGEIIRHLRAFVARGENQWRPENLAALIEEASTLALVGTRESGVRVGFAFDRAASRVFVDKIQIQQVILNLMRNGIEAMQETPRRDLTIATVVRPDKIVEISVADTGTGIARDIASRLFQPFMTTKPHGMGIGLSISRSIVEAHGGKLWVEPNAGGGTIFRFTLKAFDKQEPGDVS